MSKQIDFTTLEHLVFQCQTPAEITQFRLAVAQLDYLSLTQLSRLHGLCFYHQVHISIKSRLK